MLAIRYDKGKDLYNWFGCYVKDVKQSVDKHVVVDNFRHLILSHKRQDELHNLLMTTVKTKMHGKTVKTTQEYTVKLEWVALMLMGAEVPINVLDNSMRARYFGKGNVEKYSDIVVTQGAKKEDESAYLPSLIKMRSGIRSITHAKRIRLIVFDNIIYKTRMPDYITRLTKVFSDHGCLYTIPLRGLKALQSDIYYQALFKERVVLREVDTLTNVFHDPQTTVCEIRVNDIMEHSLLMSKCETIGVEVDYILGSRLILDGVTLECILPLKVATQYKGTPFHENWKLWLATCKGSTIPQKLSPNALIQDVETSSLTLHSVNAHIIANKLDKEIAAAKESKFDTRVNMIIIGNKGTGKSSSSEMLKGYIELVHKCEVRIISSDSYGRWLYDVMERNDLSNINDITAELEELETSMITEEYQADLDMRRTPTWYEMQANKILYDGGITGFNEYMKLSKKHRDYFIQQMLPLVNERIVSDAKMSFTKYYVQLQSVMMTYKVGIFECHFTEESTQIARSDLLYMHRPILDGKYTLLGRLMHGGGNVGELLLYDVYEKLIGSTSPEVYLSELIGVELGYINLPT